MTVPSLDLVARLQPIRLVAFDVDGTLTDGSVILGEAGEWKSFNIADGLGMKLLMRGGIEVAWITGRISPATERRAQELGVTHLFQGEIPKSETLGRLAKTLGLAPREIAAMGDDLPDLPMFARAGIKLAPADAAPEILAAADWVAPRAGGRGAARDAAELILRAQGKWEKGIAEFAG